MIPCHSLTEKTTDMKKIKFLALTAICVLAGLVSCETYKVQDPEMSAVSDFDGKWICFGVDQATGDSAVYFIEITNDTFDSSDKIWLTIVNNDPGFPASIAGESAAYYYLDAIRFKANCNNSNLSFQCDTAQTTAPYLVNNEYLGQTYYSLGYAMFGKNAVMGQATIENGLITRNAVPTGGNKMASAIEFTLKRSDALVGTDAVVNFKGMKMTGWYEDEAEYVDFMYEYY